MVREGNLQIEWNVSFNYSFRNVQGIGFICMIAYNCYIFFSCRGIYWFISSGIFVNYEIADNFVMK